MPWDSGRARAVLKKHPEKKDSGRAIGFRAAADDDTVGVSFVLFSGGGGGRKHFIIFDTFLDLAYTSTQKKNKMSVGHFWAGGETPTPFWDL